MQPISLSDRNGDGTTMDQCRARTPPWAGTRRTAHEPGGGLEYRQGGSGQICNRSACQIGTAMERPWTNAEREPLRGLEPGALPMSQEEALSIVKAVAVKYATDQPVRSERRWNDHGPMQSANPSVGWNPAHCP